MNRRAILAALATAPLAACAPVPTIKTPRSDAALIFADWMEKGLRKSRTRWYGIADMTSGPPTERTRAIFAEVAEILSERLGEPVAPTEELTADAMTIFGFQRTDPPAA